MPCSTAERSVITSLFDTSLVYENKGEVTTKISAVGMPLHIPWTGDVIWVTARGINQSNRGNNLLHLGITVSPSLDLFVLNTRHP